MRDDPPFLSAKGLRRRFGGLRAVDGVDLDVPRGAIVGLIGPNGAGKTTLFDLLTGFQRPDAGSVHFNGADVSRLAPHARARKGLVRTFQITRALRGMTVLENLLVASQEQPGEGLVRALVDRRRTREREDAAVRRASDLLERFDLATHRDAFTGTLSGGQKKLLELARAMMARPTMLLLDEPVAGVNPTLAKRLMADIRALRRDEGLTILLIEHDMETVFGICDEVVVMNQGRVIARGEPQAIRRDPIVLEAYLGAEPGGVANA